MFERKYNLHTNTQLSWQMFSGRERCYLYDRIIFMILIGGLILPDRQKDAQKMWRKLHLRDSCAYVLEESSQM